MNGIIRQGAVAALAALATACATAGSGGARLSPGGAVSGRLTPADPEWRDGSHYRRYDIAARAGDVLTFSLQSDDFDAYLILTDRFGNPVARDDDGGGDCNAQLTYAVRTGGPHRLIVGSAARAEIGGYRLTFTRRPAAAPQDSTCAGFGRVTGLIEPGQTVAGELTADDPMFSGDSTYFQRWVLPLARGQTVTVDLDSQTFDAYLLLTRGRGDKLVENDDGGSGCNARLVYTATDDHPVRIVVNTVKRRTTGRYVLRVTLGAQRIDPKGNCPGEGDAFTG